MHSCSIYMGVNKVFPYCLFVSKSQVIGCEDRLQNDLYCVGWAYFGGTTSYFWNG